MAPLRLALCITDLEAGGAERCLVELATRVDRARFEPVVYSIARRPPPPRDVLVRRLEQSGVACRFLQAATSWSFPIALRRLTGLLAAQRPQVVQTFLFHANILGRLAARWAGSPPVLAGIRVAEHGSRWHLWLDRWTHGLVVRHVCVSDAVARFAEVRGKLPPEKMVVIPNGIDATQYPASRPADLVALGVPAGHAVVTFAGRLEWQKGVDWLIASAPPWLKRRPECDLLVVGEGPESRQLVAQCKMLGISGRVHFAGWRDDLPAILAASRLLVLPSRWEGMPNVVLEAMASRLPVVATDVEGLRELLGSQAGPQLVPPGDHQALGTRILSLLDDSGMAGEIGQSNRDRVEQAFSLDRVIAAYQDLWESAAGS
jgi:starch synthase (maltosyl-transferring)